MDNADDERRSRPSRIIVADDHPLFRTALRQMLSEQSDLKVVTEAADGREAVRLCRRLRPGLVLMDVRMPKMDGLEATREIKRESPSIIVLMLTAFEDPDYLLEALKAGASGYLLKHMSAQQIARAIRRVLEGESPLDQEVAMSLLMRLIDEKQKKEGATELAPSERPSEEHSKPLLAEPLSPREVEVLRLLTRGQPNEQIARNLFISVSTVKNHVQHIISKLGVSDSLQAAVLAIEHDLLANQGEE